MRATRRLDQMRQAQAAIVRSLAVLKDDPCSLCSAPSPPTISQATRSRADRAAVNGKNRDPQFDLELAARGAGRNRNTSGVALRHAQEAARRRRQIWAASANRRLRHHHRQRLRLGTLDAPETKAETLAYCEKSMMAAGSAIPYRQRWGQNIALVRQGGPRFACTGVIVLLLRVALLGHRHDRGINDLAAAHNIALGLEMLAEALEQLVDQPGLRQTSRNSQIVLASGARVIEFQIEKRMNDKRSRIRYSVCLSERLCSDCSTTIFDFRIEYRACGWRCSCAARACLRHGLDASAEILPRHDLADCSRSSAWIWLFSSMLRTRTRFGGDK